jgi:hypothetical protein
VSNNLLDARTGIITKAIAAFDPSGGEPMKELLVTSGCEVCGNRDARPFHFLYSQEDAAEL